MPRQPTGPKLVQLKKKGFKQAVWYIRYRKNKVTTEVTTGTTSRAEAYKFFQQEWLPEYYRQENKAFKCDTNEYPIIDALLNYAEEHAEKTTSPERIGYAIKALEPFWSDKTIANINLETCEAYHNYRDVSDSTIRRELVVLRASLNHAKKRSRIDNVPVVFLPKETENKERWLTRSEAASLLWKSRTQQARLYLPLFIIIGLYTGARKTAILELKWNQVDLINNRINFNPPGRIRTTKKRSLIPISKRLKTFLVLAHKRRGNSEYVIHNEGKPLGDIKKGFKNATVRAELEDVSPHTLRHTAATWLALNGVSMFNIGGFLGQSVESTTARYAHHHPNYMNDITDVLDLHPRYILAKEGNRHI